MKQVIYNFEIKNNETNNRYIKKEKMSILQCRTHFFL